MEGILPDSRRQLRLDLTLPVRVRGDECAGAEWTQLTRFVNANQIGARFALTHPVELGRLVHITSKLPGQLRCFDFDAPEYSVWAIVTNIDFIQTPPNLRLEVGVAFIGPRPPDGYRANPSQLYRIAEAPTPYRLWTICEHPPEDAPSATRLTTRHPVALELELQTFAVKGQPAQSETTVTENLSYTGAAVYTSLNLARGRFVNLVNRRYKLSLLAVVRTQRLGADGQIRLHLEFVDKKCAENLKNVL